MVYGSRTSSPKRVSAVCLNEYNTNSIGSFSPFYQPMPLQKRALPFDDPNFVFELKYDGFRALAVIDRRPQLVSRNGNSFGSFADLAQQIAEHLPGNTVIDGEIVAVDRRGQAKIQRSHVPSASAMFLRI